jgi:hypothetical protein
MLYHPMTSSNLNLGANVLSIPNVCQICQHTALQNVDPVSDLPLTSVLSGHGQSESLAYNFGWKDAEHDIMTYFIDA